MKDRRKLKRRHLVFYLRVSDANTGELVGHLVDITTEGIMLVSENPIDAGAILRLRMSLPLEIDGSKQVIFGVRSVWCARDVNPEFWATGFQLLEMASEETEIIHRLIDDFGFRG